MSPHHIPTFTRRALKKSSKAPIVALQMEEKLKELGDPSGKQSSEYWDEWFNVVCAESHRPFEWYCDVDEVARLLCYHLPPSMSSGGRMIHPGSGNSRVPVRLRNDFGFPHKHVVVDISSVALEEMRSVHDQNVSAADNEIEYLLGDVLEPPLPLEGGMFDVWLDKGLVDALFNDSSDDCRAQSDTLFSEAFRLLRSATGMILIVTMAEEHSLKLILNGFWRELQSRSASLHVWDLEPVSGDMLPFGLVLQRTTRGNEELILSWHHKDNQVEEVKVHTRTIECLLQEVSSRCETSRADFKELRKQQNDKTLATIEIKPWDSATDLEVLKDAIVGTRWTVPSTGSQGDQRAIDPDWRTHDYKVVPIGYGISKLVLQCTVNSDDLDVLVDAIREWEGIPSIEDGVQSVDIDWNKSVRIAAFPGIAISKSK